MTKILAPYFNTKLKVKRDVAIEYSVSLPSANLELDCVNTSR